MAMIDYKPGQRVQTKYGMTRYGTVIAYRPPRREKDGGRLDICWDDTRREVCTGVWTTQVEPSSVVEALAQLIRPPSLAAEPRSMAETGMVYLMEDDRGTGGQSMLPRGAALQLGFALLGGEDDEPWW